MWWHKPAVTAAYQFQNSCSNFKSPRVQCSPPPDKSPLWVFLQNVTIWTAESRKRHTLIFAIDPVHVTPRPYGKTREHVHYCSVVELAACKCSEAAAVSSTRPSSSVDNRVLRDKTRGVMPRTPWEYTTSITQGNDLLSIAFIRLTNPWH